MRMDRKQKIRQFIDEHLHKMQKQAKYTDDQNIFQTRIVNSLFAMRLLKYFESEFQITITENDLKPSNFYSINNMILFLDRKSTLTEE